MSRDRSPTSLLACFAPDALLLTAALLRVFAGLSASLPSVGLSRERIRPRSPVTEIRGLHFYPADGQAWGDGPKHCRHNRLGMPQVISGLADSCNKFLLLMKKSQRCIPLITLPAQPDSPAHFKVDLPLEFVVVPGAGELLKQVVPGKQVQPGSFRWFSGGAHRGRGEYSDSPAFQQKRAWHGLPASGRVTTAK